MSTDALPTAPQPAAPQPADPQPADPQPADPQPAAMPAAPSRPHVPFPPDLVDDAVALARQWLTTAERSSGGKERRTAARLGALVADPAGLELAVRFVDDVARPPDRRVAAAALPRVAELAGSGASFLGPVDRRLLAIGAKLAPAMPWLVVPAARRRLRGLVGHLVADAGRGLAVHLARTRADGFALNVNLLGEAVLGEDEANARLKRTIDLVERPDVDYVSIKVSSVASQLVTWDLPGSRDRVVARLLPLLRAAKANGVFVNLDMEEYRDLALTTAVFRELLGRPEFMGLTAGIVLQCYLPDALGALAELTEFAGRRVAAGGAPIKIRLVKGANLAMEQVEAQVHDWAQAPYPTKAEVDANFLRLVDQALTEPHTDAVRIGVASHNLFDVALAVLLARRRGVSHALDVEMLQGMSPGQARAVRDAVHEDRIETGPRTGQGGRVVLYTPVVRRADFDVAISYLIRRLEENAAAQNFLHAMFAPAAGDPAGSAAMQGQEAAFRASAAAAVPYGPDDVTPRRLLRRPAAAGQAAPPAAAGQAATPAAAGFMNAADTDPALAASRTWAQQVIGSAGVGPVRTPELTSTEQVDDVVALADRLAPVWAAVPAADRAAALDAAADRLEAARTELVEAMVHEAGKTVAEADPEVSEAVDFARYYALAARRLTEVPGARFNPDGVTLVTPPWNFPVAIPVGGVLSALAAGSPVIAKPAPATPRCLEVAVAAIHAGLRDAAQGRPAIAAALAGAPTGARAGAPGAAGDVTDLVQFVRVPDAELGTHLACHRDVARVILTGSIDTARLFAAWRPDRPVLAETSGKNAIIVTPSADLDLAVADVVKSAFGHAGQKCSAASLVILVGSAGDPTTTTGRRVRRQLIDAVHSLRVGPATELGTTMGPLTEPASDKLSSALQALDVGEQWLVQPRRLSGALGAANRLWTPGLKTGVRPGSWFHRTECFGPVLGIMTAETLDEAIEWQNAVDFGLTGGIHSLDAGEIERWLDRVEVGNAYVNRHITGAIVQRQPFGGWKHSAIGPGAKAGGPNYVAQLGSWSDDEAVVPARAERPQDWLAWAEADDERWWAQEFAVDHDPTGLQVEANILRYRPIRSLTVRVGAGALDVEVARVVHAAEVAGVPAEVVRSGAGGVSDQEFAARVAAGEFSGRIRVIGHSAGLAEAAAGRVGDVTVLAAPVVASGRRELLTVLREQAISRTRHRYGHVR